MFDTVRIGLLWGAFFSLILLLPSPALGQPGGKDKSKDDAKPALAAPQKWKVDLEEGKHEDKEIRFKQGETVQISVQSETKGDVDLIVLDAEKRRIAADVTFGPNCFVKFTAAKTAPYTVQVKNWGPGASRSLVEMKKVGEVAKGPGADEGNKNYRDQLTANDGFDRVRMTSRAKIYNYKMKAGTTYTIRMMTNTQGFDPYLRLEDAAGQQLAFDDDSDGFPNAKIVYAAQRDGNYRIIATSFTATVGAYTLTVEPGR